MKKSLFFCLRAQLVLTLSAVAAGTWVPLANSPSADAGHFLLLSDGTVIAENLSTNYGPGWFRLTPDIHGSYINGTWSTIAAMNCTRLDFSSDVLSNGTVFVAGGEYGAGTTNAEIYDPVANTWTDLAIPPGMITTDNTATNGRQNDAGFMDSSSVLLSNGKVLITPVYPANYGGTVTYDPAAGSWSTASLVEGGNEDEAGMVKLPDDSILVVDSGSTNSERYIPALNLWLPDANVPVQLYDTYGNEEGPGLLLPNGKAIFFGATSHTAIYTPSGSTNAGSWAAGPDFPNGQGMPDAPAAMMANGKILCAVEQAATNSTEWYPPVTFFEYDYLSNSFTQVTAPGGGSNFNDTCWPTLMLDLPDGSVLFGHRRTDFYVYQPDGVPLAAGQPAITSISTNHDGSLHLTGTLFNGLSQGAAYGDDEQMDSNFPIVRFTDASGNVRYGRTYNWSRTSVATGSAVVTTECTVPPGVSLLNAVQVVANGIASTGLTLNFPAAYAVTNTADSGPGSLRQAIANSVPGATINFAPNLSGQTITLTSGELPLTQNLTVDASALPAGIILNGNHAGRIFEINAGTTVGLIRLTIINGYANGGGWGGGVENYGALTLSQCSLVGNSVSNTVSGGAIASYNSLTLSQCTLATNSAGFGGAIENTGSCTLTNCTLAFNSAQYNSGAIDNNYGTLSLTHCTLSLNTAGSAGGAIYNYNGALTLLNSIIAGNSAPDGGGLDIYNPGPSTITNVGTNLVIGQVNSGGGTTIGPVAIASDPTLASLGDFGGPTLTMPPLPGSPAVDAAAATPLAMDQRGFPRPLGLAPDIGAVEGIYNATGPGTLLGVILSASSSIHFTFTNYTDTASSVLTSTNVSWPLNTWSNLGAAVEIPIGSGHFQFTDPQPATNAQRFYLIRSP